MAQTGDPLVMLALLSRMTRIVYVTQSIGRLRLPQDLIDRLIEQAVACGAEDPRTESLTDKL